MKNHECPHLSECKQFIFKHDFEWKCLGKISWNQENCFKSNLIGTKELRELPMMWWAKELLKRWKESKKDNAGKKKVRQQKKDNSLKSTQQQKITRD